MQSFSSPSDLTPITTLIPLYDLARTEERLPPAPQPFFAPPAWVAAASNQTAPPGDAEVQVGQALV